MTDEDRAIFYKQQESYRYKCEEFKIELDKYLLKYATRMDFHKNKTS